MTSPAKTTATAPVNEIGYQQAVGQYMWWLYENETTPELIWPQSVYVYDQMRRTDAQVGSVLRAVTLPVLRTPWRIDPAGARDEVVQLVADDLGLPIVGRGPTAPPRKRDRFSWQDHLSEALLMLPIGYSYFEQVYRIDPSGDRAHLRKLALRPARTIEYVNVAPDGGLVSIKQYWIRSGERPQPIPVDRLVAYIHAKEGGNWLGTSILRNCYKNWLLKDRLLRVQAQTIERNGMGIPLYKGQDGAPDLTTGLAMAKAWRAGDAAGTAIPFGADLVLRGVEGTLPDAEPAIRYHDEQIARAVLAHFLNLGTQTGSWALGNTFADFFVLSLQTLAQQIADTATCHVIEDLVDINFGEDEPAPRLTFDEIGSRQNATAEALLALIKAGVIHPDDVLEESSRQRYGLPPRDPNAPPPGPMPGLVRETIQMPGPGASSTSPADTGAPAPVDTGSPVKAAGEPDPKGGAPDEPDDDDLEALEAYDEASDALVVALAEFAGDSAAEVMAASFNPSLHPRNPKGTPGAGKFRSTVARLIDALKVHQQSGGKGDPFAGFTREQLRRAAVTRGLKLHRGASRDDISKALIADLTPAGTGKPNVAAPTVPLPAGVTTKPFGGGPFGLAKTSLWVGVGGVHIGAVHEDQNGTWTTAVIGNKGLTAPKGPFATQADAVKALADAWRVANNGQAIPAHPTPSTKPRAVPVSVAGIAGVTSTSIPAKQSGSGALLTTAKQSQEIHLGGGAIGTVHQQSFGWQADDAAGTPVTGYGPTQTRADAIRALVAAHQWRQANPPAPAPSPSAPVVKVTTRKLSSTMPGKTQSLSVHANGTKVGAVHEDSSGTWSAVAPFGTVANGGVTKHATRQDAVDALVARHAGTAPTPGPPASLQTSVPGVTLSRTPTLSSSPGAVSFNVDHNGTDVGEIHTAGGAGTGNWTAFPPAGAGYGLQANPGSGQTFTTRDDAVKALVDAHNLHAPPQAPAVSSTAPPFVTVPSPSPLPGYKQWLSASAGNADLGDVGEDRHGRWWLQTPAGHNWSVQNPSNGFGTKDEALKAALAAYEKVNGPATAIAPTPAPRASDPAVKAAQDVLYGVDPKGKTAARQLAVYGALKRGHFDTLDSAEQSTLLGDLAYIASTAKGPNGPKAQKLIDRFSPPGTPLGTIPQQAVIPPASAVSAQMRVADPAGTAGLLKMLPAGSRGQSGDGWTRTSAGRSGPWGQYGAAGLMLRHVDSAGVERFLMVERGPGISDPGKWQFPGGAKEEKETFHQGAAREVIEELGFKPSDLDAARIHGTHTTEVTSVSVPGLHGGTVPWAYVSIAATVPHQLVPDLSTHHARLETSDARWMTRDEIDALDRSGKLLSPLAGGQLHQNVTSLFPATSAARPGARTTRPPRLAGQPSKPAAPHKASKGRDLISDRAAQDHLRAEVAKVRKNYRGKTADERLAAIGAMQGYDDVPTVVTKAEMDRLLATGDYIEAWRGIEGTQHSWRAPKGGPHKTAAQIHEEMRSGPAYYGTGVYGNGYYLTTRRSVAEQYSDKTKNSIVRVLIPKAAKTDDIDSIEARARRASSSGPTGVHTSRSGDKGGGTLRNPGRYAAAQGLDGIEILYTSRPAGGHPGHITRPGQPAYTWVNRSVLIVQEAEA